MWDYFLNLFYVYPDWNTLPLWARIGVCYLFGCAFLSACFGIEGAMAVAYWLRDRWRWMRWFSL